MILQLFLQNLMIFRKELNILLIMNLLPTLKMIFINIGVGFEVHIQKLELLERVYLEFVLMPPHNNGDAAHQLFPFIDTSFRPSLIKEKLIFCPKELRPLV